VLGRTSEFILGRVVWEVDRQEASLLDQFRFSGRVLFLVESIVFEEILELFLFQPGIILLTAIARIA